MFVRLSVTYFPTKFERIWRFFGEKDPKSLFHLSNARITHPPNRIGFEISLKQPFLLHPLLTLHTGLVQNVCSSRTEA